MYGYLYDENELAMFQNSGWVGTKRHSKLL